MACAANTASLSCAGVRALLRACITLGRRNSLRLANAGFSGDTERSATGGEVKDLRREVRDMKELVADLALANRLLKKSMIGAGGDQE